MKPWKVRVQEERKRLGRFSGLSEDECLLHAISLAETPDERWQRNLKFLKSHGLSMRSEKNVSGS